MQLFWSLVLLFLSLLPVFCHSVMLNHCSAVHAEPLKYWDIRLQESHWNEYNNENQKAAQNHFSGKEAVNKCCWWILGRRTRGASRGWVGVGWLVPGPSLQAHWEDQCWCLSLCTHQHAYLKKQSSQWLSGNQLLYEEKIQKKSTVFFILLWRVLLDRLSVFSLKEYCLAPVALPRLITLWSRTAYVFNIHAKCVFYCPVVQAVRWGLLFRLIKSAFYVCLFGE